MGCGAVVEKELIEKMTGDLGKERRGEAAWAREERLGSVPNRGSGQVFTY